MSLPERDKYASTLTELTSRLAILFGGRVAEELIMGKENVTTGASSDIQQATSLARRMVTEFGMSDRLGRVRYSSNEQEIFLGHSVAQQKNVSEATSEVIDQEVRRLIEDGENTARRILNECILDLHKIANALLEFETLSGDEVRALLRGETIVRSEDQTPPPTALQQGKRGSVPSASTDAPAGGFNSLPQSARTSTT
jgi:cell division protease FtsH